MAGQGRAWTFGHNKHSRMERRRRREWQEDEGWDGARSRMEQFWIFGQICTVPSSPLLPAPLCRNVGMSSGHIQRWNFHIQNWV